MRAASRDSALVVADKFDELAKDLDSAALTAAADDLTAVVNFLGDNPVLLKRLVEDDDNVAGKKQLVHNLLDGKVAPVVVEVVAEGHRQRWSSARDLIAALRRQATLIVLTAADLTV